MEKIILVAKLQVLETWIVFGIGALHPVSQDRCLYLVHRWIAGIVNARGSKDHHRVGSFHVDDIDRPKIEI